MLDSSGDRSAAIDDDHLPVDVVRRIGGEEHDDTASARANHFDRRDHERDHEHSDRAPEVGEPAQVERVLREIGESFLNFQVVAKREAETRAELAATPDVVASVPYFDSDIYDLEGLIRLGDKIWR